MSTSLIICLVISVLTIAAYVWNKFPIGAIGCASIALYLLTGCVTPNNVLSNIGNSNVVMVACMFVISEGFKRTQAVKLVAGTVRKVSHGSMPMVMLGFTLASILAATFTGSALAAFCIMAPIASATCEQMNISPSKVMYCVGLTCIAACGIIPVGGSLSMFAEINGYIAANGYEEYSLSVGDLFMSRFPVLIFITLYCTFLGWRFSPEKPIVSAADGADLAGRNKTYAKLNPVQETVGVAVFVLVTFCLLLATPINSALKAAGIQTLATWEIPFIGAVILVMANVLSGKDACACIPIDMSLMIVGGLTMGTALANTGAGELIGNFLAGIAGSLGSPYVIGLMFWIIPFLLTQVMQNRTVMAIFQPIAVLACKSMGISCIGPCMLVAGACCTAFMTPMATACIPFVMNLGGYDMKSQAKQSVLPGILLTVVNVLWVMTVYPM